MDIRIITSINVDSIKRDQAIDAINKEFYKKIDNNKFIITAINNLLINQNYEFMRYDISGVVSYKEKPVIQSGDFGWAIKHLKDGKKVARKGWNGRGMYLELQVPDKNSKMTFPYPYFTIPDCEEGTRRIPYASTIVDIMSEDWEIVK